MKETETLRELLNRGVLTKPEYEHIQRQILYRKKRRRNIVIVAILSCIFAVSAVLYYGISVETYNHRNIIQRNTEEDIMSVAGKPLEFDLGSFNDLNFSKDAIYAFNNVHRGYIHYYITPTKDRTEDSLVRIDPVPNPMLKAFEGEKDFLGDKEIGPYIYKKGWKRHPAGVKDYKITTDWQPLALFYGVGFTPKALEKKALLYKLLSYGKLSVSEESIVTSANGHQLTEDEVLFAVEAGILYGTIIDVFGVKKYVINIKENKDYNDVI